MTAYLKTLKIGQPNFPVYANATAQQYGENVAEQLGDQVQQVVRFREMIEAMARDGVTRFIEVGPGRVLTGLVGKILGTSAHIAVALDDPKADGLRGWHRGLAALAADGVALDLVALFDHYEEPEKFVPAPKHVGQGRGSQPRQALPARRRQDVDHAEAHPGERAERAAGSGSSTRAGPGGSADGSARCARAGAGARRCRRR